MDLLIPANLQSVWIEFTSNCDKRCIYCFSVQKGYKRLYLPEKTLDGIRRFLITKSPGIVYVNGHGETTTYPLWHRICEEWLDSRLPLHIISHLGREFREEEIDVFSRFTEITTSVDSHLEEEHNRLRCGVGLAVILKNMERIRDRARSKGNPTPAFAWDCVVSHRNIFQLKEYVDFGIEQGVQRFVFCNLVRYPNMKEEIRHISELPWQQLPRVREVLENIQIYLRERGIAFHLDAGLSDAVHARLEAGDTSSENHPADPRQSRQEDESDLWSRREVFTSDQAAGQTRFCIEPWNMLFVQASGCVQPCLFSRHSIGSLHTNSLDEILHGSEIRSYRHGLLTGNLLEECRGCNQKAWISQSDFQQFIANSIGTK
jgi:MoaA/NifB/PqqE/SkfB family radical SAM enzyme